MLLNRPEPPLSEMAVGAGPRFGDRLAGGGAHHRAPGKRGRLVGDCVDASPIGFVSGPERRSAARWRLGMRLVELRPATARRFGGELAQAGGCEVLGRSKRHPPRYAALRLIRRLCKDPASHRPEPGFTRLPAALLGLCDGDRNWKAMVEVALGAVCDVCPPSAETRRRLGDLLRSVRADEAFRDWSDQAATLCHQTIEDDAHQHSSG